jgi:hypothetical protein
LRQILERNSVVPPSHIDAALNLYDEVRLARQRFLYHGHVQASDIVEFHFLTNRARRVARDHPSSCRMALEGLFWTPRGHQLAPLLTVSGQVVDFAGGRTRTIIVSGFVLAAAPVAAPRRASGPHGDLGWRIDNSAEF